MTNAEAKAILKTYDVNFYNDDGHKIRADKICEALDMAIQALEQQPTITSTEDNAEMIYPQVEGITPTLSVSENPNNCDLISRGEVLEMAYDMSEIDGEHFTEPHMVVDVADIQKLKPQERTGHWIIIDDCEKFIAKCSECGRIEDSRMIGKYQYCHCGARMEGETNG